MTDLKCYWVSADDPLCGEVFGCLVFERNRSAALVAGRRFLVREWAGEDASFEVERLPALDGRRGKVGAVPGGCRDDNRLYRDASCWYESPGDERCEACGRYHWPEWPICGWCERCGECRGDCEVCG